MDEIPIERRMAARHGLITRVEAMAAGMTERQIDHRLDSGRWLRVHRSVYRHVATPVDWRSDLLAACLASRGVASHQSAATLWDLGVVAVGRPIVSVPRHRRRLPAGTIVHETTQWGLRDETRRAGIPVTGIERTLLDCAGVVTRRRLERLCESAIRQNLTTWPRLVGTLQAHSRRGRDGCGRLRTLLECRLGTPEVPLSDFSRLVANLLVDAGLPEPVVEHPIHDRDGAFIMQADLVWPNRRKAIELDGLAYHFGRAERERDNRKRNRAKAEGWMILEVLWSMLVDEPEDLVETCRRFLAS